MSEIGGLQPQEEHTHTHTVSVVAVLMFHTVKISKDHLSGTQNRPNWGLNSTYLVKFLL